MNIKEMREKAGIQQKDLATMIGVSAPALCRYEKGDRRIPVEKLVPLAEGLSCTIPELLDAIAETWKGGKG